MLQRNLSYNQEELEQKCQRVEGQDGMVVDLNRKSVLWVEEKCGTSLYILVPSLIKIRLRSQIIPSDKVEM